MSYPVYPAFLPTPLRAGYEFTDKASYLRSDMDDGLARQRRRFPGNAPAEFSVTFSFSSEEHAVFRAFLEYECTGGADWFYLRILYPGEGIKTQLCRLKPNAKSALVNLETWEYKATVELKAQPLISENEKNLLLQYRFDDLLNASRIAHDYVELRYPQIIVPIN